MLAELELNENLKITIEKVEEDDNKKKQSEVVMQLWDQNSSKNAIAKRLIRWPIGQSLPDQVSEHVHSYEAGLVQKARTAYSYFLVSYEELTELVLIKGPTSQAEIPLPKSKVAALTASSIMKAATSSNVRTYASFAVNPVELIDLKSVSASVESVISSPMKDKRWKKLIGSLETCQNGEANGLLSALQQSQLFEAIEKYSDDADSDSDIIANVFTSIVKAKILTYKKEDLLLRLCIEKERVDIVEVVVNDSSRILSEFVIAKLLKVSVTKKTETGRIQYLRKLLDRNFSRITMTEAAAEFLTASEAVDIMLDLTEIYRDFENKNDISSKALLLVTILMDAHGSRIIYEDGLHQKFATISNFIIEMQSLAGTFAKLENSIENSKDDESSKFGVRRVQLVRHDLAW